MFVYSFIHLLNKYLLDRCYVPDTILSTQDTSMSKTSKIPSPKKLLL